MAMATWLLLGLRARARALACAAVVCWGDTAGPSDVAWRVAKLAMNTIPSWTVRASRRSQVRTAQVNGTGRELVQVDWLKGSRVFVGGAARLGCRSVTFAVPDVARSRLLLLLLPLPLLLQRRQWLLVWLLVVVVALPVLPLLVLLGLVAASSARGGRAGAE